MTDNELITALRTRAQSLEFNLRWLVLECVSRLERKTPQTSTDMSEWVSVKDRLPDGMEDVLVCVFWHERWQTLIGWCRKSDEQWYAYISHGERSVENVSHWMPLPQPPVATDINVGHKEG